MMVLILGLGVAWGLDKDFTCASGASLQDVVDEVVDGGGGVVDINCADGTVWEENISIDKATSTPVVLQVTTGAAFTLTPKARGKNALFVQDANVEVSGFRLYCDDNSSVRTTSLVFADTSTLALTKMAFEGCSARTDPDLQGMALYTKGSVVTIHASLFIDNAAGTGDAIYCQGESASIVLSNSLLTTATTAESSQFFYSKRCAVTLNNNVFQGRSGDDEPALSTMGGTAALTNNLFLNYVDVYHYETDDTSTDPTELIDETNACDVADACLDLPDSLTSVDDLHLHTITDLFTGASDDTCLAGETYCLSAYEVWPTIDSALIATGTGSHTGTAGSRSNTDIGLTGGDAPWWPDLDGADSGDKDGDTWPELYECDDDDSSITMPELLYVDNDGDSHAGETTEQVCPADGYYPTAEDCDDTDDTIHPEADETCDDIDNDCDASIDEDLETTTYYADTDGDGHGDPNATLAVCQDTPPVGYVVDAADCDDEDNSIGVGEQYTYYADADSDGYGDETSPEISCDETAPAGYVDEATDCDDSDPDIHPGATELVDTADQNCDGSSTAPLDKTVYCGCHSATRGSTLALAFGLLLLLARKRRAPPVPKVGVLESDQQGTRPALRHVVETSDQAHAERAGTGGAGRDGTLPSMPPALES